MNCRPYICAQADAPGLGSGLAQSKSIFGIIFKSQRYADVAKYILLNLFGASPCSGTRLSLTSGP